MPAARRMPRALLFATLALANLAGTCGPSFEDDTSDAGVAFEHAFDLVGPPDDHQLTSGGVAAADYDADGDIDLYVVGGSDAGDRLLRNLGDGTFEDVTDAAGVARSGITSAGPAFVDYDGDGTLDLLVPTTDGPVVLFRGVGDGTFEDRTFMAGLWVTRPTISAAFGDLDLDGDLDLYLSHWGTVVDEGGPSEQLFRNEGDGTFSDATDASGIGATLPAGSEIYPTLDLTLGPTFTDIDDDGWPDLLVAGDFGTSQILRNTGGTFDDVTTDVIDDENGMGVAVADFDNDCDVDWFVTSIRGVEGEPIDGLWGITGNRLYRNDGQGVFTNVTEAAGVRDGGWGWGACAADFDNDGHLDLFHTNGWVAGDGYADDPSRLFLSNGDGTFSEQSVALGIDDRGMGRGVACFDADRDGDIDVFVANIMGTHAFYRNQAPAAHHWLNVRLEGPPGNTQGVGARIYLATSAGTQMREIQVGSGYASQHPAEAHFGLGEEARVLSIVVRWLDGRVSGLGPMPANRQVVVSWEDDALRGATLELARARLGCS